MLGFRCGSVGVVTGLRAGRSRKCDAMSSWVKIIFLFYKASSPVVGRSLPSVQDHGEYGDGSVKVTVLLCILRLLISAVRALCHTP
jgi:hypothetical protein